MAYCHQKRLKEWDGWTDFKTGRNKEGMNTHATYICNYYSKSPLGFFKWTWESNSLPFLYLKSVQFATSYVVINSATKYIHLIVDNIRIMKEASWRNLKEIGQNFYILSRN